MATGDNISVEAFIYRRLEDENRKERKVLTSQKVVLTLLEEGNIYILDIKIIEEINPLRYILPNDLPPSSSYRYPLPDKSIQTIMNNHTNHIALEIHADTNNKYITFISFPKDAVIPFARSQIDSITSQTTDKSSDDMTKYIDESNNNVIFLTLEEPFIIKPIIFETLLYKKYRKRKVLTNKKAELSLSEEENIFVMKIKMENNNNYQIFKTTKQIGKDIKDIINRIPSNILALEINTKNNIKYITIISFPEKVKKEFKNPKGDKSKDEEDQNTSYYIKETQNDIIQITVKETLEEELEKTLEEELEDALKKQKALEKKLKKAKTLIPESFTDKTAKSDDNVTDCSMKEEEKKPFFPKYSINELKSPASNTLSISTYSSSINNEDESSPLLPKSDDCCCSCVIL